MTSASTKTSVCAAVLLSLVLTVSYPASFAEAALRKAKIGQKMPPFALQDPNGRVCVYDSDYPRALAVAFLSTTQAQSLEALEDIQHVVDVLQEHTQEFDFLIVVNESDIEGPLKSLTSTPPPRIRVLMDSDHKLWGSLGVVAKPTTLVVGPEHEIIWVHAGHGYDYQPSLRLHLAIATGIEDSARKNEKVKVRTLTSDTITAKVDLHVRMSRMFEDKGRFELAAAQLRKALDLDPNSITMALDLAEFDCRIGRPKDALDVLSLVDTRSNTHKARALMVQGWAQWQFGNTDKAEQLLLSAIRFKEVPSRAFFELGNVYRTKGNREKALELYYRALILTFPEPKGVAFPSDSK